MSAISDFKATDEYKQYSVTKKQAFEKLVKELVLKKTPRALNVAVLTKLDVATLKGKVKNLK
jgi:hypothetical protein